MTPDEKRVALLRLKFDMLYRGLNRADAAARFAEIVAA
jgi:hypothetical protein